MEAERIQGAADVPYIVFETAQARLERESKTAQDRLERSNQRLCRLLFVVLLLLFASNAAWIWYENQYETVAIQQEVDTGDAAAVVSGMGDAYYGEG